MKNLATYLLFFFFLQGAVGQVLQNEGNIQLTGSSVLVINNLDVNHNGNFTADTGSLVVLLGNQANEINGTQDFEIEKLEVDRSGALTLNTNIEVGNKMTFSDGIIYTSSSSLLKFLDGATPEINSNLSFVNGPFERTGNSDFTFPIGNASLARTLEIKEISQTETITVEYVNDDPTFDGMDKSQKSANLHHVSQCEYWSVSSVGNTTAKIVLSWNGFESCGVTEINELKVAFWEDGMWKDGGAVNISGDASSGSLEIDSALSLQGGAFFTLGSSTASNPLPVDLLSFNATAMDETTVSLTWFTLSEVSTESFTIEKSIDGIQFTTLGSTVAAGNATTEQAYKMIDQDPQEVNYYRLWLTNKDGSKEALASNLLVMEQKPTINLVVNGQLVNVNLNQFQQGEVSMEVYDLSGKMVHHSNFVLDTYQNRVETTLPNLPKAIYLVKLVQGNTQQSFKFNN